MYKHTYASLSLSLFIYTCREKESMIEKEKR